MTPNIRASSRGRLLSLPVVFTKRELVLASGLKDAAAAQYVWRWKTSGLVRPLGGKSDVYINLVRSPDAGEREWNLAMLRACPSAVMGGYQVLMEAGVTTQVTHLRYVVISRLDSMFDIDGAEVYWRPTNWIRTLAREGALETPEPGFLVPRMRPGAAIADMALFGKSKLDPDDVDMDSLEPQDVRLYRRLMSMKGLDVSDSESATYTV